MPPGGGPDRARSARRIRTARVAARPPGPTPLLPPSPCSPAAHSRIDEHLERFRARPRRGSRRDVVRADDVAGDRAGRARCGRRRPRRSQRGSPHRADRAPDDRDLLVVQLVEGQGTGGLGSSSRTRGPSAPCAPSPSPGAQRGDGADALDHDVSAARERLRHRLGLRPIHRRRAVPLPARGRSRASAPHSWLRSRARPPGASRAEGARDPSRPARARRRSDRDGPMRRCACAHVASTCSSGAVGIKRVRERMDVRRRDGHEFAEPSVPIAADQRSLGADVGSVLPALGAPTTCDARVDEDPFTRPGPGRECPDDRRAPSRGGRPPGTSPRGC